MTSTHRRPALLGAAIAAALAVLLAAAPVRAAEPGTTATPAEAAGDWLATDIHRWGFRLTEVAARTLIWAGRHDPGRAAADAPLVAARIPNAPISGPAWMPIDACSGM